VVPLARPATPSRANAALPPRRGALAGGAAVALVAGTLISLAPTAGADSTTRADAPGNAEVAAVGTPEGFAALSGWGQDTTTGGAGGETVTVTTAEEFVTAASQEGPLVIQVDGMIALPGPMVEVTSDKTVIGVGADSGFTGAGLNVGLPLSDEITEPPDNAVHVIIQMSSTTT
jgi:pectate lyase